MSAAPSWANATPEAVVKNAQRIRAQRLSSLTGSGAMSPHGCEHRKISAGRLPFGDPAQRKPPCDGWQSCGSRAHSSDVSRSQHVLSCRTLSTRCRDVSSPMGKRPEPLYASQPEHSGLTYNMGIESPLTSTAKIKPCGRGYLCGHSHFEELFNRGPWRMELQSPRGVYFAAHCSGAGAASSFAWVNEACARSVACP